jgi:hypothetical protein
LFNPQAVGLSAPQGSRLPRTNRAFRRKRFCGFGKYLRNGTYPQKVVFIPKIIHNSPLLFNIKPPAIYVKEIKIAPMTALKHQNLFIFQYLTVGEFRNYTQVINSRPLKRRILKISKTCRLKLKKEPRSNFHWSGEKALSYLFFPFFAFLPLFLAMR